jgi:hypothetical protein
MIRPAVLRAIADELSHIQGTAPEDFSVEQGSKQGGGASMLVTYRYHPSFRFSVTIPGSASATGYTGSEYKIEGTVSPGELIQSEKVSYSNQSSMLSGLRRWAERVTEELRAMPVARQIAEQQKQIDEILADVADVSEGHFSREEAAELKAKLDDLQTRMVEHLKERDLTQQDLRTKVETLQAEIATLKLGLDSLSKKGWVASLKVRVARWTRDPDNMQLLKSGTDFIKQLLLPPGDSGQK